MNILKDQIDDAISHMSGKAIMLVNTIGTITAALTLADWLDLGSKGVTFIITIIVGLLSARYYMLRNRKLEKEIELKDQEIYRMLEENKKKGI